MSSAYLRLLIFLLAIFIPACASSSPAFLMMYSAYKLNMQGDNIQPWCTPFPIWNQFCQENALVIANTLFQQHKRRLYTWTSPDGQHQNQIDYILCSQRWSSSIQSAKTRLEADCGSDHELLIAKFRLRLQKVEKTTRPFKYDLNQIPNSYTVEVRNRFKGFKGI